MTEAEFNVQMQRLVSNFGKAAYSAERAALIWQEVRPHSADWFRRTVDRFIGEHRQAPLLPEFREAIARGREIKASQERRDDYSWDRTGRGCPFDQCHGNGVFLCKKPDDSTIWVFRCHCQAGLQDPRTGIPFFKQQHVAMGLQYHEFRRPNA